MHKSIREIKISFLKRGISIVLAISTAVAITYMQFNLVDANNSSLTGAIITENQKSTVYFPTVDISSAQKLKINAEIDSVDKKKDLLTGGKLKISTDLLQLVDDNFVPKGKTKQQLKEEMRANKQYKVSTSTYSNVSDSSERVYVYVYLKQGVDIYATDGYMQEITNRDAKNGIIVGWVDINNLQNLASNNNVRFVKTVVPPKVNMGSKITEGVVAQNADKVLSKFKQSGAGMKIGVISNGVYHIESAVTSGDLPSDVTVLSDTQGGSEGVAMMEIIYDMAPSAKLYFHDCGADTVAFNSAIDDLITAGCNIIVDDISWIGEPFFEDGTVAQHVTDVINNNNIIYLSSAGNEASRHYQGMYEATSSINYYHKYPLYVYIPAGGSVDVILQWDDKFGSSTNNYNLYLFEGNTSNIIAQSIDMQGKAGNYDPIEGFSYKNTTSSTIVGRIAVDNYKNTAQTKTLEIFGYPHNGSAFYSNNITPADSIFGHAAVPSALAVGAVNYIAPNAIRNYSSLGPTTITYPSVEKRIKPDICGVDGVSVTGAGNFGTIFYGTSAAAPHVAAVAALLWAEFPQKTGNEIRDLLTANAKDLGSTGLDTTYGYGISDAMKAFMATMTDHCFMANITQNSTLPVAINSSGDTTNEVWFAPAGTANFVEGSTMTKATGDATSINAPTLSGDYKLYLKVDGVVSAPSTATLTVIPQASIDSLTLTDTSGTQLSSLTIGQTVYITSTISGDYTGKKVILAVYNSNSLMQIKVLDYNGSGTYKTSFVLPALFQNLSCKAFVFKDVAGLKPLATRKELLFSTIK